MNGKQLGGRRQLRHRAAAGIHHQQQLSLPEEKQGRSAAHCPAAAVHLLLLQLNRIKLGKARRKEARGRDTSCPGQAAGEGRHVSGGGQHERDLLRRGRPAEEIQPGEFLRFFGESYPECCCSPLLQNPHQGRKGGERAEKRARCRSLPTALPNGPMS